MHTAVVRVGSRVLAEHKGGYLPFEVDLSEALDRNGSCEVEVELDNRDTPDVPPGKPLAELDFCWYGGLYREVELRRYPAVRITDENASNTVGGGGVFLRTLEANTDQARVLCQVEAENASAEPRVVSLRVLFTHNSGRNLLAQGHTIDLHPGKSENSSFVLNIDKPRLWSVSNPELYQVLIELLDEGGRTLDQRELRFGVRQLKISRSGGLELNGERIRPNGTNRHQDFPGVGYALPRAAQYRDARLIKEAGFDYVRLSHYPQSAHFMNACDELGLLVMNCIPGWQFLGGGEFRDHCYQNARELIRRDRNHACVILWELSLNETEMDSEFMETLHAIGHEEFPGDQMYTCGWQDSCFDVYIHARQHGKLHSWSNGDKAMVVSEYGDWEFYAANDGFDQTTGAGLLEDWANSRAFRGHGEAKLRQQALNHAIAHNDTMGSDAICDGQWGFADYPRGYHKTRAACGVVDFFRLPKYSHAFYRSQRRVEEGAEDFVQIASGWTQDANRRVFVFGNGDEVRLVLNGKEVARQEPSSLWYTQHLKSPPFVFELPEFEPGELCAISYRDCLEVARDIVRTPSAPECLALDVVVGCDHPAKGEADVVAIHARVLDAGGNLCLGFEGRVHFEVKGAAELWTPADVKAESGIASVSLRYRKSDVPVAVEVCSEGLATDRIEIGG
ncbi:glycoside hydrolase family 2 TIM barrel-domain containing protein [Pelagicoccus mobilis]|uniref:DUF4982 domain-containing protein n=1 Tax=Pelagicoccus mobilis TaxID=415221 RepID=A0A934RVB2_9BACT|nr:glycoside hydrolase family 2 TIM barrel-domain containing protein [Pelagicoccus mobilis]MBK1878350.1 DUF4982 domain-containing protein [Pelagicoccus mobilis]